MKRFIISLTCYSLLLGTCFAQQNTNAVRRIKLLKKIPLPAPNTQGTISVESAIKHRRSIRDFTDKQLTLDQVGQLAWAAQGVTDEQESLRAAPSAGAIYPMQLHIVIPGGAYKYNPPDHSITKTIFEDIRADLTAAALDQQAVAKSQCIFIISGSSKKVEAKYSGKGQSFMLIEAGHIAQNIQLQAVAMGLGSTPLGSFDIKKVWRTCKLDLEQKPVYIIPIGYPANETPIIPAMTKPSQKIDDEADEAKRAVLIIPPDRVRDEELFDTQSRLAIAGVKTIVAGLQQDKILSTKGRYIEPQMLVGDIVVDDFDAVIFIGGQGVTKYFDDNFVLNLVAEAARKGKVIAAISKTPTILANAGVLRDVSATSFSTERKHIIRSGAKWTHNDYERDGNIITANGPMAADLFANAIIRALNNEPEPEPTKPTGHFERRRR